MGGGPTFHSGPSFARVWYIIQIVAVVTIDLFKHGYQLRVRMANHRADTSLCVVIVLLTAAVLSGHGYNR